jgi:hypothetical protein
MAKTMAHREPAPDGTQSGSRPANPRRRFNWALVPAVWILTVWTLNHVQPALTWSEILDRWHIQGEERIRMTRLVALGVLTVGAVLIRRIWVAD